VPAAFKSSDCSVAAGASIDEDFLHRLLHDLKGPVCRLHTLSELIERRAPGLDPETQLLLGYIKTAAGSAETVLDGLQRYLESLRWTYRPARFDLNLALNAALSRLKEPVEANRVQVTRSELPFVCGDIVQMSMLFEELISNALRFRSDEPLVIEVDGETGTDGSCVISIADNGVGITNSAAERLFRPFVKASDKSGAGVGLAICRYIVELHGGEISTIARSRGAEFRIRLPR
jgi:signal transduction histidine kinase